MSTNEEKNRKTTNSDSIIFVACHIFSFCEDENFFWICWVLVRKKPRKEGEQERESFVINTEEERQNEETEKNRLERFY